MKVDFKTVIVGLLLLLAFILTFLRTPQEIQSSLTHAANSTKGFALAAHIIFAVILTFGLIFKGARNLLFFIFHVEQGKNSFGLKNQFIGCNLIQPPIISRLKFSVPEHI